MSSHISLSQLDNLPTDIARPNYKRSDLKPGIVHIGVGNFHRAHQASYMDRLFNLGEDLDWAIIGAGLTVYDEQRRAQLAPQDWLTTIIEMGPSGPRAQIIGSMLDFCESAPSALLNTLQNPNICIVTLTITEGGYFIDPETSGFDDSHPHIVHDIHNFSTPKTVFGILLRALWLRREAGIAPFTILSCDNLLGNGEITHQALMGLAVRIPEIDAKWVETEIACPNCMVDCITPATTDAERALLTEKFGIEDAAPVFCEPFKQWVIEDNFPTGRPALEKVGVEFTDDVSAYEELKLNILNAGHAAIAYPAALLGIHFSNEAMADEDILAWFKTLLTREVLPNLKPANDITPSAYLKTVTERFSNPAIKDSISRLCEDGENRQPKFIFPSIKRALKNGTPIDGLALETALWCRFLADNPGPQARANISAAATQTRPDAFVLESGLFGELSESKLFVDAFSKQITKIWDEGARQTLRSYIGKV